MAGFPALLIATNLVRRASPVITPLLGLGLVGGLGAIARFLLAGPQRLLGHAGFGLAAP